MRSLVLLVAFLVLPAIVRAEEPGTVVVGEVSGEVEVIPDAGSSARALRPGDVIQENDRIYTGFDSKVELRFSDGSAVVVQELTDMKVGHFRTGEGRAKTRLWLRAGELDAKVKPSAAGNNDFHIKTPTTTCSVRGTNPIVTTALGFTAVSFVTGYGDVTDDGSGRSTDTRSPQSAENDPDGGGLSGSSDLARGESHGGRGATGLTRAEANSASSLVGGDTTVGRGDVAGNSNGTGTFFQSFSERAALNNLLPPAVRPPVETPTPQNLVIRNTMQGVIDSGELFRVFNITEGMLRGNPNDVRDVNISVTFSKAAPTGTSPRFNEISMQLINPAGITVPLIALDTYFEGVTAFQGTVTFDQNATMALDPAVPTLPATGIFRPVGDLDEFRGGPVTGSWGLNISNNDSTGTGNAPITYDGAVLTVTH